GDDAQGLLLSPATDQDRYAPGGRRVQIPPARADDRKVTGQRVEPAARGTELVAVLVVVALEPAGTGAEGKAARTVAGGADVVDGAGHVGLKVRVAIAVAVDQGAELNPAGLLGERRQHGPRLEVSAVRVAREWKEVVPGEQDVNAQAFELCGGLAELRVV